MSEQDLLAKFYSTSDLVSVDIVFQTDADWTTLAMATPAYFWRDDAANRIAAQDAALRAGQKPPNGPQLDVNHLKRYDWIPAQSVTISSPTIGEKTFNGVTIIKKSFMGSISSIKPSLKIDFSRHKFKPGKTQLDPEEVKKNAAKAKAFIGTEHLILNNSVQDNAYVRQPLGYEMFRQAGLPYARCNLAQVTVNKRPLGIYCNLEPIVSPYLQRNFNKNDQGNLYETEEKYDLDPKRFPNIKYDSSGFSDFEDQKDLELAVGQFTQGMSKVRQVFDIPQIIRVLAMQAVVNHWDGYPNNTFFYNDTNPVKENPQMKDCNFKAIPSGIDQIFTLATDKQVFRVKKDGWLSRLILEDPESKKALQAALKDCIKVFETNLKANLTLVDTLAEHVNKVTVAKDPTKHDVDFPRQISMLKDQLQNCVRNATAIAL